MTKLKSINFKYKKKKLKIQKFYFNNQMNLKKK